MMFKAKHWVRIWFVIDFLGIALLCFLILAYLLSGNKLSETKPLSEIWAIISLISIGAWLSVRVIDNLFRKKKYAANTKYRLLSYFEDFLLTAGNVLLLTPFHGHDYVRKMIRQQKHFSHKWHRQKRFFTKADIKKLRTLLEMQQDILETCQTIGRSGTDDQEVELLKGELKTKLRLYGDKVVKIRLEIQH